jgi:hypothetical protein
MAENQPSLFPNRSSHSFPQGFAYCPEAISAEDESRVLAQLADLPFKEFQFRGFEGKRRVVSFGWRYDFNDHKVLQADPIPQFLLEVYRKVEAVSGFVLQNLQQVLVTEYAPRAPNRCIGFYFETIEGRGGLGLISMEERVRLVNDSRELVRVLRCGCQRRTCAYTYPRTLRSDCLESRRLPVSAKPPSTTLTKRSTA